MSADLSSMKILWNPWVDEAESGKRKAEKIFQTGRGFSLIELLGVLAVMGILAAITVPPIIRQIQQARTTNEDANLEEVARAIVEGIKATGTIPNPNLAPYDAGGWADVAYRFTTLSSDSSGPGTLHYVFPAEPNFRDVNGTARSYADTARRVYLDPDFLRDYLFNVFDGTDGPNTGVGGPFDTPLRGWPETTTVTLDSFPNRAIKLYIVSSSRPDYVLDCPPNGPGIQVAANNYGNPVSAPLIDQLASWIKAIDPATRFVKAPGAAVENWSNSGHQFLHVKVVDLRPLFCRVNLREFPYPQTATTQTANPGGGYTAATTYSGNIGAFSFSFIAPAADFNNPGPAGTAASSIALSGSKTQITRNNLTTSPMNGLIPAPVGVGGLAANFDITINNPPWWDISPPTAVNGQQMPNNANTQSFYVIKGTSLSLYDIVS